MNVLPRFPGIRGWLFERLARHFGLCRHYSGDWVEESAFGVVTGHKVVYSGRDFTENPTRAVLVMNFHEDDPTLKNGVSFTVHQHGALLTEGHVIFAAPAPLKARVQKVLKAIDSATREQATPPATQEQR